MLENIQMQPSQWAILQNYKNRNGEAPLVKNFKRNAYGRVADTLGVERYQSVPLYLLTDTVTPERYGQDGELTRFIEDGENFVKAEPIFTEGEWMIPKKYVKVIGDTVVFNKAIFVDRHNQNITALERTEKGKWVVCAGNSFRNVRTAGKEGENDISERRLERDRRLCALRQPLHGRGLHSRSTCQ